VVKIFPPRTYHVTYPSERKDVNVRRQFLGPVTKFRCHPHGRSSCSGTDGFDVGHDGRPEISNERLVLSPYEDVRLYSVDESVEVRDGWERLVESATDGLDVSMNNTVLMQICESKSNFGCLELGWVRR
jgi:hypothetical protein